MTLVPVIDPNACAAHAVCEDVEAFLAGSPIRLLDAAG